ncbi:YceI family protein [uncultured Roseivirga sp.]|uniref:YceI family protein n=1 Tax=uncultured Roseivirga sp. TaxID=543088 RepID=UPI000D7AF410|nr:YceI family protein [uncultured Roseivirga sp.]PWL32017.1 MAG: YceI family protein [Roseivirga sp. XM-24bin3]
MKFLKSTLALSLLAVLAVACGSKSNTVETSEAKEVASADDATAITVNTQNSMVTWIGSKPTGKHNGSISIADGEIMVNNSEIVGGNFTIDITSLKALDMEEGTDGYNNLVGHLMSPDFFDAENHPTATFEVTEVKPFSAANLSADKDEYDSENKPAALSEVMVENPTHFISGNLTMRGTTKNITFPAHVEMNNGVIKAKANFNIDRTAWGLSYNTEANFVDQAKDKMIYDTVNVGFELEAGNTSASE